ncbi:hypothetical protein K227x_29900 [Rubripirellula lacrimiformis]|uniref:Myosin heavy chain n=1 Tax=Rubripirellula lacrimiformis TaxID=1930273 RepID=A0A517NBS6_9BACT|nr:hypothetical protein [Rubripirellula lacrimiformis]QDT04597.1 hypothetical protein K227x_29900 [Rubripirellula lacrimiformis]
MAVVNSFRDLPSSMDRKLKTVTHRSIVIATIQGLAIALSAFIVMMILSMALDWMLTLRSPIVRIGLTSVTFLIAIFAFIQTGIIPAYRCSSRKNAAELIDQKLPLLQQRWQTVADATQKFESSDPRSHPKATFANATSRSMVDQVTSEAVALQTLVKPSTVVPASLVLHAVGGLLGAGVLMAGFMASHTGITSALWKQFWNPLHDITATNLQSQTGDAWVPRGKTIQLVATQDGVRHTKGTLVMEFGKGDRETLDLTSSEDRTEVFSHRIRVDQSIRYQFTAGDGRTEWHELQVIDYPEIEATEFVVVAPEYAARDDVTKDHLPRRIKVIEGSSASLAIKPRQPVQQLTITVQPQDNSNVTGGETSAAEPEVHELSADKDGWFRFEMMLYADIMLRPNLISPFGLSSETKSYCRIDVISDKPPVARIIQPNEETAVAVDEVIEIEFEAHDDHGIATANLVVYDESKRDVDGNPEIVSVQPIAMGDQTMPKHMLGKAQLDLSQLNLSAGAEISYAIRVSDNRGDPQSDPKFASSLAPQPRRNLVSKSDPKSDSLSRGNRKAEASDPDRTSMPSDEFDDESEKTPGKADIVASKRQTDIPPNPNNADDLTLAAKDATATTPPTADGSTPDQKTKPINRGATGLSKTNAKRTVSDPASIEDTVAKSEQVPRLRSGQNTSTQRRRLKITERLSAIAAAKPTDTDVEKDPIRERVQAIDKMLKETESGLGRLIAHDLPDSQRSDQFVSLDQQIGQVEKFIADLRMETEDSPTAFVGLQMVDLARTHITPARDRVFGGIRNPNASDLDAKLARGHINRARETLAALLQRYQVVKRDRDLNKSLEDSITIYEVYVEKKKQLLRAARQNRNPLTRKMGVIEVDQAYLDRYSEVLTLRREMMTEFAGMLGDDPRLLSRYLDLLKRRSRSLRDQLGKLSNQQSDATSEMLGWQQIDEDQRHDLWIIMAELRLPVAERLAKEAAEFAERTEKQMPLEIDVQRGTAAKIIHRSQRIAEAARQISLAVDDVYQSITETSAWSTDAPTGRDFPVPENADVPNWVRDADQLSRLFPPLDVSLDLMQSEQEGNEDIESYLQARILESRAVADLAGTWASLTEQLSLGRYDLMVAVEQRRLAIDTESLRTQMQGITNDLETQFLRQGGAGLPASIAEDVDRLQTLMLSITFNQIAATQAAERQDLDLVARQQTLATDRFEAAESLFDKIRRDVADALDEYDMPNPNIAQLRDPTLDEFLARLEREPNIAAQLGIPDRRTNLRVIADSMLWQQTGGQSLGTSGQEAMRRAKQAIKKQNKNRMQLGKPSKPISADAAEPDNEEQREQLAKAKQTQKLLEESLLAINQRRQEANLPESEKEQLTKLGEKIEELLDQGSGNASSAQMWQQLAQSDQANAIMKAIADGDPIPDDQWNKLLSNLGDGLWQVKGKKPPEAYRRAIQQYQDRLRQLWGNSDDA